MFMRPVRQFTAPLRTLARRQLQLSQARPKAWTRFASNDTKFEGSINSATFYKTFGRPIAKVFLMAIFTYQLAYYFWVRLEQDETRAKMQATISELEARVEELEKAKVQKTK
ncbi:hypothetical protein GGR57DRAFT_501057 [Xylariaceae sp. FL1272]|nr:hypothetical protein GGR57DRAFT_501057 [Xylariaceae sp. FL1272]